MPTSKTAALNLFPETASEGSFGRRRSASVFVTGANPATLSVNERVRTA